MAYEQFFTRFLDEVEKAHLQWIEKKRGRPCHFFGRESDADLTGELFKDRIPGDIGDSFVYLVETSGLSLAFSQQYFNSQPLSTQQYLFFNFRVSEADRKSDNPLADSEGFGYLRAVKAMLRFSRYESGELHCELLSQNLDMHRRTEGGWGEPNTFTQNGEAMLNNFLAGRERLLHVAGLRWDENLMLEERLQLVYQRFCKEKLEPRNWEYT